MVWNAWNVNGSHRKAEVAKFISYKIDFKSKTISRDREGHYIVIKADSTERYNNYKPPNIKKANIGDRCLPSLPIWVVDFYS